MRFATVWRRTSARLSSGCLRNGAARLYESKSATTDRACQTMSERALGYAIRASAFNRLTTRDILSRWTIKLMVGLSRSVSYLTGGLMAKENQQPDNRPWRAVIVDDEPRSRAILRRMLSLYSDFKLVAECANGYEALAAVSKFLPDLLVLDIQMPEIDGFAVLKQIDPGHLPLVVFVTAYDEYAVRAFEV